MALSTRTPSSHTVETSAPAAKQADDKGNSTSLALSKLNIAAAELGIPTLALTRSLSKPLTYSDYDTVGLGSLATKFTSSALNRDDVNVATPVPNETKTPALLIVTNPECDEDDMTRYGFKSISPAHRR